MARRRADRGSFREKHGALCWRGQLPEKTEGGEIVWRPVERSTRTLDQAKARLVVDAWQQESFAALSKAPVKQSSSILFAHAVTRYLKKVDKNHEYLGPILDEIGLIPIEEVDQETVEELAVKLYPGRTAATLNRQVFTPICAVLNVMASKTYTPPRIKRPKGHLAPSNFKRPPKDWFQRVLPECPPNLAALLLFCRLHGRRTSEACRITPADLDTDKWRVTVHDTKTCQEIVLRLADAVIEQLERFPWRLNQYVFGFSSKSRLYPALRAACERARVPYHVPKDVGRHSFATGSLAEGRSLKELKEAGRWKTIKVPDMIYGHLEHSQVDDQAREIGDKWAAETMQKGDVVSPDFRGNSGTEKKQSDKRLK